MPETIRPRETLASLVTAIQKLAQLRIILDVDTLSCMSADGLSRYKLSPTKHSEADLLSMNPSEISTIVDWTIISMFRSQKGMAEAVKYDVTEGESGNLSLYATEHVFPSIGEYDIEETTDDINSSIRLQVELGMAEAGPDQYNTFASAVYDLNGHAENIIRMKQVIALTGYTLGQLTNPN